MKKPVEINIKEMIEKIYFKIAKWHNNDEELNVEEMQNRLFGLSKEIIDDVTGNIGIVIEEKSIEKNEHKVIELNDIRQQLKKRNYLS